MAFIKILGARQNNLKNLSLNIPLEKLVCITGPSGSGKSSLAFETLHAEGYRRYVESLSTYARQFLERLPRPDVDSVENICPSIALQQNNPVRNSRSTVGTSTEVYDYLRLLFSKLSDGKCPSCGKAIKAETPQSAADDILAGLGEKSDRAYVGFTLKESLSVKQLIERGFVRRLKNTKEPVNLEDEDPATIIKAKSQIVFDRLTISQSERHRLIEAIEGSMREGHGNAFVLSATTEKLLSFSSDFRCASCDMTIPKPSPLLFSFNSPLGACNDCQGFGNILEYDEKLLVPNPRLTLERGAVDPFTKPFLKRMHKKLLELAERHKIPTDESWAKLSADQIKTLMNGDKKFKGILGAFKGIEKKKYKVHVRVFIRRYQSAFLCKSCKGSRLRPEALYYYFKAKTLFDLVSMPLDELYAWMKNIRLNETEKIISKEILRQVLGRLHFLNRMGLGYLTLNRLTKTLSGGEAQRINLANQLGAELSGTLYVLDEPSVGLHPCDRDRLIASMRELVDLGNSVVVVEHDLATIDQADEILELGPGSGKSGGAVVFQGSREKFESASTVTARFLKGTEKINTPSKDRGRPDTWLTVQGAKENNLKSVTLNVPLKRLVGIAGVSGSGKSTLIHHTLHNALARLFHQSTEPIGRFEKLFGTEHLKGISLLDQSPIGRSSRSIPMTMIGAYDEVRSLFSSTKAAQQAKLLAKHFSFNVQGGRCDVCSGEGVTKTEMFFLDDLYLVCETCDGKRFKKDVLAIKYRGKSIDQIFRMTVRDAMDFFSDNRTLKERFEILDRVGLGYLELGQTSHTLSGGESQRLKIASELLDRRKKQLLYILDEPTTGLHSSEVGLLIDLLQDLVESGNTVIVIEHQVDVLKSCDWIIELGPGAGVDGGEIVAEGTPIEISKLKTKTAPYLQKVLVA